MGQALNRTACICATPIASECNCTPERMAEDFWKCFDELQLLKIEHQKVVQQLNLITDILGLR